MNSESDPPASDGDANDLPRATEELWSVWEQMSANQRNLLLVFARLILRHGEEADMQGFRRWMGNKGPGPYDA